MNRALGKRSFNTICEYDHGTGMAGTEIDTDAAPWQGLNGKYSVERNLAGSDCAADHLDGGFTLGTLLLEQAVVADLQIEGPVDGVLDDLNSPASARTSFKPIVDDGWPGRSIGLDGDIASDQPETIDGYHWRKSRAVD